ncbi:unnamed protein product [Bursaphelenchus xylophilus]|uniref:Mediator of RNA polymerase II transcription subunit 13 n=1 Tax=Bursaphelenchus xylophilus TaxID=6326 RepID=A0A1I7SVD8_BURXY|nr:unnamed protein product [Bursaphelenchus xylophilus]CAG9101294.1 unnamed protein product [Bursaphelenchus xylophilus]
MTTCLGSLEECQTNVLCFTELYGLKWKRFSTPNGYTYSSDIDDDPIIRAFRECVENNLHAAWRRRRPEQEPGNVPLKADCPKELFVFWFAADEPPLLQKFVDDGLVLVSEVDPLDPTIKYETRILFYKAFHYLFERNLWRSGYVKLGKWFVRPLEDGHATNTAAPSHVHAFHANFQCLGETNVCMLVKVQRQDPILRMSKRVLALNRRLAVILGPWSIRASLLPDQPFFDYGNKKPDVGKLEEVQQLAAKQFEQWSKMFPSPEDEEPMDSSKPPKKEANDIPKFLLVEIHNQRLLCPSYLVTILASELDTIQNSSTKENRRVEDDDEEDLGLKSNSVIAQLDRKSKRLATVQATEAYIPNALRHNRKSYAGVRIASKTFEDACINPKPRPPNPSPMMIQTQEDHRWNVTDYVPKNFCYCKFCNQNSGNEANPQPSSAKDRFVFHHCKPSAPRARPSRNPYKKDLAEFAGLKNVIQDLLNEEPSTSEAKPPIHPPKRLTNRLDIDGYQNDRVQVVDQYMSTLFANDVKDVSSQDPVKPFSPVTNLKTQVPAEIEHDKYRTYSYHYHPMKRDMVNKESYHREGAQRPKGPTIKDSTSQTQTSTQIASTSSSTSQDAQKVVEEKENRHEWLGQLGHVLKKRKKTALRQNLTKKEDQAQNTIREMNGDEEIYRPGSAPDLGKVLSYRKRTKRSTSTSPVRNYDPLHVCVHVNSEQTEMFVNDEFVNDTVKEEHQKTGDKRDGPSPTPLIDEFRRTVIEDTDFDDPKTPGSKDGESHLFSSLINPDQIISPPASNERVENIALPGQTQSQISQLPAQSVVQAQNLNESLFLHTSMWNTVNVAANQVNDNLSVIYPTPPTPMQQFSPLNLASAEESAGKKIRPETPKITGKVEILNPYRHKDAVYMDLDHVFEFTHQREAFSTELEAFEGNFSKKKVKSEPSIRRFTKKTVQKRQLRPKIRVSPQFVALQREKLGLNRRIPIVEQDPQKMATLAVDLRSRNGYVKSYGLNVLHTMKMLKAMKKKELEARRPQHQLQPRQPPQPAQRPAYPAQFGPPPMLRPQFPAMPNQMNQMYGQMPPNQIGMQPHMAGQMPNQMVNMGNMPNMPGAAPQYAQNAVGGQYAQMNPNQHPGHAYMMQQQMMRQNQRYPNVNYFTNSPSPAGSMNSNPQSVQNAAQQPNSHLSAGPGPSPFGSPNNIPGSTGISAPPPNAMPGSTQNHMPGSVGPHNGMPGSVGPQNAMPGSVGPPQNTMPGSVGPSQNMPGSAQNLMPNSVGPPSARGPGSVPVGPPIIDRSIMSVEKHPALEMAKDEALGYLNNKRLRTVATGMQDTILDLFYDSVFDACPICSCNVNIRTTDLGIYIQAPAEIAIVDQINSRREQDPSYRPDFWSGLKKSSTWCGCGFSAVRYRILAAGAQCLFPDDLREAFNIHQVSKSIKHPWLAKARLHAMTDILRFMSTTYSLNRMAISTYYVGDLPDTFAKLDGHYSSTDSPYIVSKAEGEEFDLAVKTLLGLDPKGKIPLFHPWGLSIAQGVKEPKDDEYMSIIRDILPVLETSIKQIRGAELNTRGNLVEGPLTWRQFHKKAIKSGQDDETYKAEQIPQVLVAAGQDAIATNPQLVHMWEKLSMAPYDQPKDVLYLAIVPDGNVLADKCKVYLEELSSVYEKCRFGRHLKVNVKEPNCQLKDGIFKIIGTKPPSAEKSQPNLNEAELKHVAKMQTYVENAAQSVKSFLQQNDFIFERKSYFEHLVRDGLQPHYTSLASNPDSQNMPPPPAPQIVQSPSSVLSNTSGPASQGLHNPNTPSYQQSPNLSLGPHSNDPMQDSIRTPENPVTPSQHEQQNPNSEQNIDRSVAELMSEELPHLLPHIIVIYLVDPFSLGSEAVPKTFRYGNMFLVHMMESIMRGIRPERRPQFQIEVVNAQTILDYTGVAANPLREDKQVLEPVEVINREKLTAHDILRRQAFSVYSQTRILVPENARTALCQSMTRFGPAAQMTDIIDGIRNRKEEIYFKLACQPYVLAPKHSIGFQNSANKFCLINPEERVLFVSYCLVGDDILIASCTDQYGHLHDTTLINLHNNPQPGFRLKQRLISLGIQRLWLFIQSVLVMDTKNWRVVICKVGKIGHGEFRAWSHVLSKKSLRNYNSNFRVRGEKDVTMTMPTCRACAVSKDSSEGPVIMSACLISMESEPFLRIFPAFSQLSEQKSRSNSKNNNLLTLLEDTAITHIITFPTSPDISTDPQAGQQQDDNDPFNFGIDGIENDDEGLTEGLIADMEIGEEQELTIDHQPMATGYMVSTAPATELPDWFWNTCPNAKRHLPVHLRTALHINSSNLQEDIMNYGQKSGGNETSHPLDESATDAILRYVMQMHNSLSWLNVDLGSGARISCLPVHIQCLFRLYNNVEQCILN